MDAIGYGRHFVDESDIEAVVKVLRSDFMTQGPMVDAFEDVVARFHGAKYAVAFCNGTAALHGAYFASGIGEGDTFITSPNTFVASANGGVYLGATPVLCDISLDDYNIDVPKVLNLIDDRTKVITPVSFAGFPMDLETLYSVACEKGIVIIHDAAHALGAKRNGAAICDFAHMAILSFHPVKHVTTGEGGIVLTNDEEFYQKLRQFRTHGITKQADALSVCEGDWYYEMQFLGYNYRIADLQCALGIEQMKRAGWSLFRRNEIALAYEQQLGDLDWLRLPANPFDRGFVSEAAEKVVPMGLKDLHSYHLFPVLVENSVDRKAFFDYLRRNKIMVQVHYIPMHFMPFYQERFGVRRGDFPVCEEYYSRAVSIPMFPTLTELQLEYVIEKIRLFRS